MSVHGSDQGRKARCRRGKACTGWKVVVAIDDQTGHFKFTPKCLQPAFYLGVRNLFTVKVKRVLFAFLYLSSSGQIRQGNGQIGCCGQIAGLALFAPVFH